MSQAVSEGVKLTLSTALCVTAREMQVKFPASSYNQLPVSQCSALVTFMGLQHQDSFARCLNVTGDLLEWFAKFDESHATTREVAKTVAPATASVAPAPSSTLQVESPSTYAELVEKYFGQDGIILRKKTTNGWTYEGWAKSVPTYVMPVACRDMTLDELKCVRDKLVKGPVFDLRKAMYELRMPSRELDASKYIEQSAALVTVVYEFSRQLKALLPGSGYDLLPIEENRFHMLLRLADERDAGAELISAELAEDLAGWSAYSMCKAAVAFRDGVQHFVHKEELVEVVLRLEADSKAGRVSNWM